MNYWLSMCVSKPCLSALLGLAALTWELPCKGHGLLLQCLFTSDLQTQLLGSGTGLTLPMHRRGRCDHYYVRVKSAGGSGVCMCGHVPLWILFRDTRHDQTLYQDYLRSNTHFSSVWRKAKEIVLRAKCFIPGKGNRLNSCLMMSLEPSQLSEHFLLFPHTSGDSALALVNSKEVLCWDLSP